MKEFCKNCLLPTNYLNIEIGNDGICNYCHSYQQQYYLGEEKLLQDVSESLKKNTSKKYDCVVGFSGGRDSTYLLWYIVKKLKLRPLAIFSDDQYIPEIALENLKTTANILNVDLRIIKHDYLVKCLPHHLNAWIKRPVPESLMFLNVGERIGYETLVEKEAIKEGVHLIFGGRTPIQSNAAYKTDIMKIGNKGGIISWIFGYIKQILLNPSLALNLFCLKIQYNEFMINSWKEKLIKDNELQIIHPYFKYLHWDEKEIENILFTELNWKIPQGTKRSGRIGCEIDTLRQYLFLRTLGYNDSNVDISGMIRDNQISREIGAIKLEESLNISEEYIKYIINKAGVNADKFMKVLDRKYPIKKFEATKIDN